MKEKPVKAEKIFVLVAEHRGNWEFRERLTLRCEIESTAETALSAASIGHCIGGYSDNTGLSIVCHVTEKDKGSAVLRTALDAMGLNTATIEHVEVGTKKARVRPVSRRSES